MSGVSAGHSVCMDNQTILWIVIGVAVLLVIIAIIYAVTRNNDDDTARRRPMQRRGGVGRGVDPDRRPRGASRADEVGDVDPDQRRRGRRDRDPGDPRD